MFTRWRSKVWEKIYTYCHMTKAEIDVDGESTERGRKSYECNLDGNLKGIMGMWITFQKNRSIVEKYILGNLLKIGSVSIKVPFRAAKK